MSASTETRRVALVTGAGGGLGAGIARELARKGFALVLNDIAGSNALSELAAGLDAAGTPVGIVLQDIAAVEELDGFVERAHACHGRLDCLVNNAGVSVLSRGDVLDVSPESFDRCVSVNLRAQFFLTQRVARRMLKDPRPDRQGGTRRSIVTVSSVAVDVVTTALAEYAIAKAGLPMMVKQFAVRLADEGIDCHEVRPGFMATSMTGPSQAKYDALIASGFVPANRWGQVEEVGRAVALLASGELGYAVAQALHIDGGMFLRTL